MSLLNLWSCMMSNLYSLGCDFDLNKILIAAETEEEALQCLLENIRDHISGHTKDYVIDHFVANGYDVISYGEEPTPLEEWDDDFGKACEEALRKKLMKRLTKEERKALGLK